MKQIAVSKGKKKMVTWTDKDPKLKPGNSIKFKGPDQMEFWRIDEVFDHAVERVNINRSWNVGGL